MKNGFSIIEVIVVVAILGVLLLLGVPQYRIYQANADLKNSALLFQSNIEFARAEAQRLSSNVLVQNSNPDSRNLNTARIVEVARDLGGGKSQPLKSFELPANVVCSFANILTFQPNATLAGTNAATIIILRSSQINSAYSIIVQQNGFATVAQGEAVLGGAGTLTLLPLSQ